MSVDEEILKILEKYASKGSYISMIKKAGHWPLILQRVTIKNIKDTERVFRFFNPAVVDECRGNNKLQFNTFRTGFRKYCSTKNCSECTEDRNYAAKQGVIKKYGVDNVGKLPSAVLGRDGFWSDHSAISHAASKRTLTNIKKYGCENVFQNEAIKEKIKTTTLNRFGVENISYSDAIKEQKRQTCLKNFGVEYGPQSPIVKEKSINTSLLKFGVPHPMQNEDVKKRMMQSKIENGSFTKSNSSAEATAYFRNYIKEKQYSNEQVAYADSENNLHEWGYYGDRWYLYDFVAFELGHRGDASKIIEIVEYNGPFHYTEKDVATYPDKKAFPWKNKGMTIKESYEKDMKKEQLARQFTQNYVVIWSKKWHK